ncbi:MAG TPA: hypothetical protein DC049_04460, partial [Spirochaetia bacterium]|nr:hypothetical protein [Spirochaetia bacterium]
MHNNKNISGLTSKKYGLKTIILPALSVFFLCSLACAQNLLKNGDFSDLDGQKKPKDWIMNYEGNGLEGSTVIVPGPEGKKALKIECSKFPLTQNQKWIIIKQDSILKTRKGQKLLVSFWVKKEKITSPLIDVWLMNISPWSTIAKTTVPVSEKWEKVEAILTPNIDSENTRFELFFTEEGALYLSDISVTETDKEEIDFNPVRRKMEKNQLPAKEKNIIVNSGFETGIDGWGISDFDYTIAQIDNTQFFHGKKSVCLDFSEDKLPISYSDYPQSKKTVMQKIQFTGQGWLRLEKGAQYTLSLYGMANNENQNAVIGVYYMTKKKDSKTVSLSPQWKRYDVSFTAQDIFAFVFIDSSAKTYTEKIWIDAVQLEKSSAPSEYTPRFPAEMAIYAKRKGNIYYAGEEISVSLVKFFHDVSAKPKLSLSVIDYRSNVVFATQGPVSPEEGNKEIKLPVKENGYYTLSASVSGENYKYMLSIPFIIIYPYAEKYGAMNAR